MNICIIPARGGSKRIPHKNIKKFNGKPIIAYSIEAAIKSKCFDEVVVSTDDDQIAEVAKNYGASLPFVRPKKLSNDFTETLPVIKHAIKFLNKDKPIKYVCCLYATAPFIQSKVIKNAFEQLINTGAEYCFSVSSFSFPIQRALKITNEKRLKMLYPENAKIRSQDLEKTYQDAGQFYWGSVDAFINESMIFSEISSPYILPSYLVQDIDTHEDWIQAEIMYDVLKIKDYLK